MTIIPHALQRLKIFLVSGSNLCLGLGRSLLFFTLFPRIMGFVINGLPHLSHLKLRCFSSLEKEFSTDDSEFSFAFFTSFESYSACPASKASLRFFLIGIPDVVGVRFLIPSLPCLQYRNNPGYNTLNFKVLLIHLNYACKNIILANMIKLGSRIRQHFILLKIW